MSEKPKENLIQEAQSSQETTKKQSLEVAVSAGPDSLQEKLGVLGDAIAHDEPITEANIAELSSAVEGMKISMGGKEVTLEEAERLSAISTFLRETTTSSWGVKDEHLPKFRFEFVDPKEFDYKGKSANQDESKFGQYTLNPETFGMDFEKSKVFIPDLSKMDGKKLYEVFKYVVDTYGDKYYIPGIEYWKWMIENPDKAEETAKKQNYDIKDGYIYHLPGSCLCDAGGTWCVPGSNWEFSRSRKRARWLGQGWNSNCRVILLEK